MNIERIADLDRRAAVHAALGDVARLKIVETLRIGDASPSELASALAMPSNLLAFHLKTLESVGLVTRHRSEGDRRRTYLRLANGVIDELRARPLATPERVVFVCSANSARSHLAAALWRSTSQVPCVSGGTRPAVAINPGAVAVARRRGLKLPRLRPTQWQDVATATDLIVTVCDRAHEELGDQSTVHWSVPDPVPAGNNAAFDAAYDDLSLRVGELARLLSVPA